MKAYLYAYEKYHGMSVPVGKHLNPKERRKVMRTMNLLDKASLALNGKIKFHHKAVVLENYRLRLFLCKDNEGVYLSYEQGFDNHLTRWDKA